MRVTDNSSLFQTVAFATKGALTHGSQRKGMWLYADSRAATDTLQHTMSNDIIYTLTIVLTIMQRILAQSRRVIINWIPPNIGINENEPADRLAKIGRGMPQICPG